jgi:hypothetical protein
MAARKRSLVKFYIRAREPMDAEVSAALDSFAAENSCDRSGAARHLILLGKRHWRDCGLQTIVDPIQRRKIFPSEFSEAVLGSQRSGESGGQSCSEIMAGTVARSSSMVSAAHARGDSPTTPAHDTPLLGLSAARLEKDASAKPTRMDSSDVAPSKRLNAVKLRFRSKLPNEMA